MLKNGFCGLNGARGASDLFGSWDGCSLDMGGKDGTGCGLVKMGMGASDLGLKEGAGARVTSLSKWNPHPD